MARGRSESQGQLDLLLLAVLSRGPEHGYAVVTALRERSRGVFDVAEGSVYPALHHLEELQFVTSSWQMVDRRRRRVYSLTALGYEELAARQARWIAFTAGVNAVVGWST